MINQQEVPIFYKVEMNCKKTIDKILTLRYVICKSSIGATRNQACGELRVSMKQEAAPSVRWGSSLINGKYILLNTLFLLTFLLLIFFGFTYAQQSGGQKVTPVTIDNQVQKFVQSKQPYVTETIDKSKQDVIKSMIANINSMCGNFSTNTDILTSAECTTKDSNGNTVTYKMDCPNGSKSCTFTKAVHQPITITQTPTSMQIQSTPNVPPQSAVSTERWLKIFAGLVYVTLTVYLFIVASSNLVKREILFLVVDLLLWAALTSAMYVVLKGGL